MNNSRYLSFILTILLSLSVGILAAGCGKDTASNPPVRFDTGNWNNEDDDVVEDTDSGEDRDVNEIIPGFLHGDWEVRLVSDPETHFLTLHIVHEEGKSSVSGTFTNIDPALQGPLSPGTWTNDILDVNWLRTLRGSERTYSITGAQKVDENTLRGTYLDVTDLQNYNVDLIRKP